jgi:hypothetical protein
MADGVDWCNEDNWGERKATDYLVSRVERGRKRSSVSLGSCGMHTAHFLGLCSDRLVVMGASGALSSRGWGPCPCLR